MKTDGWEELAEKVGKKLIEKGLGKWEMGTQAQERRFIASQTQL